MIAIKNIIEYFYNISNLELHRKENFYYFNLKAQDYIFIPLSRPNLELLEVNNIIKDDSLYDQLVLNIENQYLTQTQKGYFVLVKKSKSNFSLQEIILQEKTRIVPISSPTNISRTNWKELWIKKIDYIEYQLLHIENKYPLVSKSINYYIGMTETAISYLNGLDFNYDKDYVSPVISHKRIVKDDFNSPMNIIVDYRARDIAEYFKYLFMNNIYNYDEINTFLKENDLNGFESQLVYARLMYPSFYFDLYDKIVNGLVEETAIIAVISRSEEYENFVKIIYNLLNNKQNMLKVEWLS